jgi:hypothetical protein
MATQNDFDGQTAGMGDGIHGRVLLKRIFPKMGDGRADFIYLRVGSNGSRKCK